MQAGVAEKKKIKGVENQPCRVPAAGKQKGWIA
jgi:hypothetical protein